MNLAIGDKLLESKDSGLLNGPIFSTYIKYAAPWTLSVLFSGSATIIDGIFIGNQIGSSALAAVNIAYPVFCLFGGIGVMLATGGSAVTGNYLGKSQIQKASAMLIKTIIAIIAIALAFWGVLGPNLNSILDLLAANGETRSYCLDYISSLLPFTMVFPLSLGLSYFVRVDGRPILAGAGYIAASFLNILLNAWFIIYLDWGVSGAAIGTGLAYIGACLIYCTHFLSSKCSYVWPKRMGKWRALLPAAWNGMSEFINESSVGVVIYLYNLVLLKHLDVPGVAAFTVSGYAMMAGSLLSFGLADSLTPLISVNNGAGQTGRMNSFLKCTASTISACGLLMVIGIAFLSGIITNLFLPDDEISRKMAQEFLGAEKWQFLFLGLNMTFSSYFTGRLWGAGSFAVATCRSLLFPVILLAVLPPAFGIHSIYWVAPIAEALSFGIACMLFTRKYSDSQKFQNDTSCT